MKRPFFLLLACFILISLNTYASQKQTVCLNMIVKNESKVIKRCLESVKPLIDYWVIVDTGSTDGTQAIIQDFMKEIPGKLYERPWVNFEDNRNEALRLAKECGDYLLFIDADEQLLFSEDFVMPILNKDFYYFKAEYSGMTYARVQLVKSQLNWKWVGVVHEILDCEGLTSNAYLEGVVNFIRREGCRSQDAENFKKDAELLEAALKTDPDNKRNVFYLAQSYLNAGNYKASLKNYQRRVSMRGWDQEVFWSKYKIGCLQETLNESPEKIIASYSDAFQYRPTRIEPLYQLANYFRLNNNYLLGYLTAKHGLTLPPAQDHLFVQTWMSDYGLLIEHSLCAYWLGKYEESLASCHILLTQSKIPDHIRDYVEKDLMKWIFFKAPELFKSAKFIPLEAQPYTIYQK